MAASALVATAGGEASFATRHKVDEILEKLTAFAAFDYRTALVHFETFAEEIRRRPKDGRARALKAVGAIADSAEDSRVILRVACAVARDEGRYPPDRLTRIEEIAKNLGQTPPMLNTAITLTHGSVSERAYCIAVGNQKGGTGKSTTAVHLTVGLLTEGHKVGCIDLDGEQGTFSHYLENRRAFAKRAGMTVPVPVCRRIEPSDEKDREAAQSEDRLRLNEALEAFADFDYLIVDTPGNQGRLSRLGHINADLLITPLNDSFLDIDVLAEIDLEEREVLAPSPYAQMVMEQNQVRTARGWRPIDWVVMRNRLAQLDTRNSRDMSQLLAKLSERMGFRLLPGFSERMIFRELFYKGLTLLDLPERPHEARANPSRSNARSEIGRLVETVTAYQQAGQASQMAWFSSDLKAGNSVPKEPQSEGSDPPSEDPFQILQQAMRDPQDDP